MNYLCLFNKEESQYIYNSVTIVTTIFNEVYLLLKIILYLCIRFAKSKTLKNTF